MKYSHATLEHLFLGAAQELTSANAAQEEVNACILNAQQHLVESRLEKMLLEASAALPDTSKMSAGMARKTLRATVDTVLDRWKPEDTTPT